MKIIFIGSFQWATLYHKKKPEGYDDPIEVGNIRYARENMGNYFLKSAPDYVVPVDQRLTVLRAFDRFMKLRLAVIRFIDEYIFSKSMSF